MVPVCISSYLCLNCYTWVVWASHCYSEFLDILAIEIEVTNELECNMLSNMMLLICCRKIGILF